MVEAAMLDECLLDLSADRVDGIESRHRLLEDHRHDAAAKLLSRALVEPIDVVAFEQNFPADARATGWVKAENGTQRDALARTRLAEQREDLPRAQLEAHRADGADDAVAGRELDTEVADAQE